jgi:hypothetical protein
VFFLLTPSARQAMMEAMNTRVEGYRGDPDVVEGHYVHGDPIDLDAGQYVTFYKLGQDPREQMRARQAPVSFGQQARGGRGGRSDDEPVGFGCFLTPEFNGMSARLREVESMVRAHVKPFWESVRVEPESVQVRWIEESFAKEADAVVYALDEAYGQYLRPEYRDRGLGMLGRGRPVQGGWDPNQGQGPAGGWGGSPSPSRTPSGPSPGGGFGGSAVPRQPAPAPRPSVGGWGAPAAPIPDDQADEYTGSEGDQLPSTEEQAAQVFGGAPPHQQGYYQPNPTYPPQGGFGGQPQRVATPDVPAPGTGIPDSVPHVSAAPVPPVAGTAPPGAQNEVQAALERARAKAAQKKQGNQPR